MGAADSRVRASPLHAARSRDERGLVFVVARGEWKYRSELRRHVAACGWGDAAAGSHERAMGVVPERRGERLPRDVSRGCICGLGGVGRVQLWAGKWVSLAELY